MTRVSALALVAAFAAAGVATPALAQSSTQPSVGAAASHKAKMPARQSARPLYNMAPGNGPVLGRDDPAGTGGGSIGYNQMLYNW